jgi:hypothetical protein
MTNINDVPLEHIKQHYLYKELAEINSLLESKIELINSNPKLSKNPNIAISSVLTAFNATFQAIPMNELDCGRGLSIALVVDGKPISEVNFHDSDAGILTAEDIKEGE